MKHLTTILITLSLVALLLGACVPAPAPSAPPPEHSRLPPRSPTRPPQNCIKQGGTLEHSSTTATAASRLSASSRMARQCEEWALLPRRVRPVGKASTFCRAYANPPPRTASSRAARSKSAMRPAARSATASSLMAPSARSGLSSGASAPLARQPPSRRPKRPRRGSDHPAAAGGGLQRAGAGDGPCAGCDGCDAVRRAHQRSRHWRQRHRLHGNGHRHRRAVREPGCGGEDARRMLVEQGWTADPMLAAGGPNAIDEGYRKGDQICWAGAGWQPDDSANCPKDQPVSACTVTPAQQNYTITLNCGVESPARRGRRYGGHGQPRLGELHQAGRHAVHRGTRRRRAVRHLHLRG